MNLSKSLIALALALGTTAAHATLITAGDSISFNGVTVTPGGSPLNPISSVTSINYGSIQTSGTGSGALTPFDPTFAAFAPAGSFNPNATGFTLMFGNYGTFTETSFTLISDTTTGQTSSNFEIYMLGNFTPGTDMSEAGLTMNGASLDLSFTDTGNLHYSGSGTLAVPPSPLSVAATPEPSSLVLLGTGLAGLAGAARRKFRKS